MQYPADDSDFKDYNIDKVERHSDRTYSITCDGWTLYCGDECAVEPKPGQTARQYGRGTVRGLFIDGVQLWYRTETEQAIYTDNQLYGVDAKEWLHRWDSGQTVWSIEMGGFGPSYEQCIQITCAEIIRWFITNDCDSSKWKDETQWQLDRKRMSAALHKVGTVSALGLSGAQFGAAVSLATKLYIDGPIKIMKDRAIKDRHILVQRDFPSSVAA